MLTSRHPGIAFAIVVLAIAAGGGSIAAAADADFSGVLEIVIEDDLDLGSSRTDYFLHTDDGKRYAVEFEIAPPADALTGSSVTLRGNLDKLTIHVNPDEQVIVQEASVRTASNRATVLLLVDFQDAAVGCSDQSVASIMFDGTSSVDGLYMDSSFGAVSFPRDTDGDGQADVFRVTIDANIADPCSPDAWADDADIAASDAAIDLSPYQHKVYVLPQTSCSWAGRANVGCASSCRSWIDVCNIADVYAHELGHNLSLRHSSTDTDNDDVSESAYGDISDFMGYGGYGWRQVNGPHKFEMGWIPPGQVIDGNQTGTVNHVLSPLEIDPATAPYAQLIKIARPAMGDDLYLSYRRRIGYDVGLRTEYVDKTSVHSHDGAGSSTLCIQMLDDGQQFVDASLGLTVLQVAHDDLSVTLQVTLPAVDCGGADADGDGVCDVDDICPGGDDTIDSDLDGTPDFCDPCPGGNDALDNDLDGLCDADDPDDDNDGVADLADCAPFSRGVTSVAGPIGNTLRLDGNGGATLRWYRGDQGHTSNVYRGTIVRPWAYNESCQLTETLDRVTTDATAPATGGTFYYLVGSRNTCGDSRIGNAGSGDDVLPPVACAIGSQESDGDAVLDLADSCPMDFDAALVDGDGDFVGDPCDNCMALANPSQANFDRDAFGDSCDTCTDLDQDGFGDPGFPVNTCPTDNCPWVANPDQTDSDGDGPGDACDLCPQDALDDVDGDGMCGDLDNCATTYNPLQTDADDDGLGDACDTCMDSDGDGFGDPGYPDDTCPTDNCPLDPNPGQADADGDGDGDACDVCPNGPLDDVDADDVCGDVDNCPLDPNTDQADADGDGTGDVCDLCPDDAAKIDPGDCGCGFPETGCVCTESGVEHLNNGDFDAWTNDDPDHWMLDETGGPVGREQSPALVLGGSGSSARLDRVSPGYIRLSQNGVQAVPGKWYRLRWHGRATDPATTQVLWRFLNYTTLESVLPGGTNWATGSVHHDWSPQDTWGTFIQWVRIDPAAAATDNYGLILRWNAGVAGESLYLDQIGIEGPFDAPCVD